MSNEGDAPEGTLSALLTLFAQILGVEIGRCERLDEITSTNLSSPSPYPYIEVGMMIRGKGADELRGHQPAD
jgi:hypothetical protein